MNLIFTVKGQPAFKLMKRDPGWEMLEWRDERISEAVRNKGDIIPARWETMNKGQGCYPTNVTHAMSIMTERLYNLGTKGDRPAIDCLKEVHQMLESIECLKDFQADSAEEVALAS